MFANREKFSVHGKGAVNSQLRQVTHSYIVDRFVEEAVLIVRGGGVIL